MGADVYDEKVQLIENVSAAVHERWMETKTAHGITTRTSEGGEELMVPYDQLSEPAKDLDRGSVKAVLLALEKLGYVLIKKKE
jgi:hypothetical protein